MNKVKSSMMNLVALVVLALFAANAAQKKRTLVYHSTLDSAASVTSPAVGAAGTCTTTAAFMEGKSGNALYIPDSTSPVMIPFEDGLPQEKGCIEYWAKMQPSSVWISSGGWPRFYCFNVTGTQNSPVSFLQLSSVSGWEGGGFCCWHGNVTVESHKYDQYGYSSDQISNYLQLFGEGDSYLDWHHYEIVWNINGLADDAESIVAVKLDGNIVAKSALAGVNIDQFKIAMGKPSELYFPLQAGFSTFSRVPYLIDEFKVWDSDVIGGEEPEQPQTEPLYCVIDLSGGTAAESYPVTYLDAAPTGGWSDEYKTNKIVLRRIDPGTYTQTDSMGSDLAPELQRSRTTTISKAFYIGVFELTQAQYQNITGENPSRYKGDTRPVEYVSYFQLRGDWPGSLFPVTNTVDNLSFMGVMRARTGLPSIDIPTEAQWEYACRAGTTSAFNNGGNAESDLKLLGRYSGNGEGEHAAVGSYRPNAWGLYDMHGNVWEWCLDWGDIELSTAPATDPRGAADGTKRALRGGSWDTSSEYCAAFARHSDYPNIRNNYGIRLMFPADDLKSISITPEPNPGTDPDPALDDGVDVVDGVTWYYTLDASGNATIVKGAILYAGDLTTPTTLDGHPVKAIAEAAFIDCTGLTSIVVQDGVEYIGSGAFARCPSLVRAILPDSATNIVESCFYQCYSLAEYRIPQRLPFICRFFFHGTAIKKIDIPEGVARIGDNAFWLCEQLEEVTLPSTLTFIDWSAFHSCPLLKRIEFPEGFEGFGVWTLRDEAHAAFGNCTGLEEAIFNGPLPTNFAYSWLDKLGCKIWYPRAYEASWAGAVPAEKFGGYTEDYGNEPGPGPDDPDPALNDGVDVIDGVTWYYSLADGVATIVKGAILYAGELTTPMTLDGHPVKAIGENAFRACPDLVSVVVSDGVETVGKRALSEDPILVCVTMPDSVTFIGIDAFYSSPKLSQMNLPPHVTTVSPFTFHETAITEIVIPEGVTTIGDCAFWQCEQLEEATLPSTLTFMDWGAFHTCPSLKRIEFPEGFEGFGVWTLKDEAHAAFGYCTNLSEAVFNGPLPTNFTYSWLDKLGCKIWYPKAYEESWAGAVPAEKFGGYTEDYGKEPEPEPEPEEIEFKTIADGGYDIGVAIKPVAVTYNGGAANAKIALAGLPNGLAFKNGAISGVPTMPGFYTVKATVIAGKKTVADKSVKMRVKNYTDPLAEGLPDDLGEFIPGVSVDITLEPVKGWKAVTLPAGLKFAPSTGRITGAPTKPGVFTVCFTKTYGYAVHAASSTMTVLPLRRLVVAKEGSGTVKGAGRYLANAKVKLTATPAKKMAVEGWYKDGVRVSRNAAYTYTMTADDEQTLVAKFVSVAEDRKSLTCTVADGATIASGKYITVTNYQGVAFSMPIAFSALTKPTVSVKGLPKGLKYAGGEIKGASTVASKKDKKGRYVATATTFTLKTLAGNSAKYSVRFVTLPRPAWAVGTYDGAYNSEDALAGRSTLSVAATGAVSGKVFARIGGAGVTATLAAASIKAYDEARGVFLVEATMKGAGIEACKVEFTLAKGENGLGEAVAAADGDAMWLVQNVWKRTALKAPAFNTKKPLSLRLANGLALKFGANGAVTFSGKVAGDDGEPVAVSGSAQLIACWDEESGTNAKLVVYAAPKANLANGVAEEIELHLKKNAKNVVTGVTEVTAAPALP